MHVDLGPRGVDLLAPFLLLHFLLVLLEDAFFFFGFFFLDFRREFGGSFLGILVLHDDCEDEAGHVGVEGGLMSLLGALQLGVLVEAIVGVLLKQHQVLQLGVVLAFVVDWPQRGVPEGVRTERKDLRVESDVEVRMPLRHKLLVGARQYPHELVVEVDHVVHQVVTHQGLLGLDHHVHYQRKSHFLDVQLLFLLFSALFGDFGFFLLEFFFLGAFL